MEEMRKVAHACVARACGFGMLAIICVMVGMSFNLHAVFQAGGILTLLMTLILILKARYALTQNYKKTEMWLNLPKNFRPPEAYAQWAASTVMRDAYFTFAYYTAMISIVMWVMALVVRLTGLAPTT
jgi:predicted membrane metal-binding protein